MSEAYKIGEMHYVKCVKIRQWFHTKHGMGMSNFKTGTWVPVIGELHNDEEIIKFPHDHYHVDWRFVNDTDFFSILPSHPLGVVVIEESIIEEKIMCKKVLRDMPEYPEKVKFRIALEKKYKEAKLKKGRCPHKGADISSISPDENGNIVCPLHGLKFCGLSKKVIQTYETH